MQSYKFELGMSPPTNAQKQRISKAWSKLGESVLLAQKVYATEG